MRCHAKAPYRGSKRACQDCIAFSPPSLASAAVVKSLCQRKAFTFLTSCAAALRAIVSWQLSWGWMGSVEVEGMVCGMVCGNAVRRCQEVSIAGIVVGHASEFILVATISTRERQRRSGV